MNKSQLYLYTDPHEASSSYNPAPYFLLRTTRTNMAAEVGADAGAVAGCEAAAADHWGCMVGGRGNYGSIEAPIRRHFALVKIHIRIRGPH